MITKEPFGWLRYIEKTLVDLDEIPLLGHVPPFDWKGLTVHLKELLQITDLEITPHNWSWQNAEQLGENSHLEKLDLKIAALPIQGHVSLFIGNTDVNSLVSWIVQHKAGSNLLVSSTFSEGLIYFVATEILHKIQPFKCFDGLMLRLISGEAFSNTRALVQDISIKAYKEELNCRLVIPETFRRNWLRHFFKKPTSLSTGLSHALELPCSLDLARFSLSMKEWKKISVGDFIPLTHVNADLKHNSASVYFSVSGQPLFRVRIKNNGFKILEQPIYQEDSINMDHDHDDLLSEISDLERERRKSLDPIPEEMDSDDSHHSDNVDEDDFDSLAEEKPIAVQTEKSALYKIETIPMNVVVEVARFKMSCEKLLHIKPGNLIELNVSLERPVDLVVNGKKIATGELVRIGESLGVQILDIG